MKPLVPLLGLVVCFGASAQAQWRLSDALGTDRGPAPRAEASVGWLLRVEPRSGGEQRTLFHDGLEDSDRLVDLDGVGRVARVRDLRGGVPIWEVAYDPEAGLPSTETSFEDGQPKEISTLAFQQRVLFRRIVKDASGTLLYTDTLDRWPDGSLRRLERDGPEGPLAEVAWSYGPGGSLTGTWSTDEETRPLGEHRETVYSPGKTEEALASATQTLVSRVTEELEAGGSQETITETQSQKVEKRLYDAKGRLVEDGISVKDVVTQVKRWTYDAQGRVIEAVTESAGPQEVWSYLYQDNTVLGSLTRGGTLVRQEKTRDGEKEVVRFYDRGNLFLEETWTGGKRVKETYYQKGVVVRERTP